MNGSNTKKGPESSEPLVYSQPQRWNGEHPVSQKHNKPGHTQGWPVRVGASPPVSLLLGSTGFKGEQRDTSSCSHRGSVWAAHFDDLPMEGKAAQLRLPSVHAHRSCRQCHYSQQDKVTAKCHQISFFTLSTRQHKWQHQVEENKERSLFLSIARESTTSRNTVGMDFEDILTNHWETKSSLSCDMWADNCLSVSYPSKWHCFYNIFVPGSLKHWLATQKSYKKD